MERNQFNYCLNYKPLRPEPDGRKWLLQLRCNIDRIRVTYPEVRDQLRSELHRLKAVRPEPFVYRENSQTVELRYTFDFIRPLSDFSASIVPHLAALISASHGIYIDAVELFQKDAPKRRVASTGEAFLPPSRKIERDLLIYSRSLSATMKAEILSRCNQSCAHCGKPVGYGDLEFHHIKPVSEGGLRVPENFVPLHIACHDEVHRRMENKRRGPMQ